MAARVLAILAVAVLFADTSGFTVRETDRLDELPPSIRALLAKMTTEEKARQLVLDDAITVATYDGAFNETLAAAYLGGLGAGVLNWGRDVDPNLANAIHAALASASKSGAPLAVVLVDGKPTAEPLLKTAPAVLAAFNGGQAQGDAIAAVLVGAANPSGRLPLSFPASADVASSTCRQVSGSKRVRRCRAAPWPSSAAASLASLLPTCSRSAASR